MNFIPGGMYKNAERLILFIYHAFYLKKTICSFVGNINILFYFCSKYPNDFMKFLMPITGNEKVNDYSTDFQCKENRC